MDMARGPGEQGGDDDRDGIGGEAIAIGTDERRMQVRAYHHWISLLRGRACPSIDDLDPAGIDDFGPNGVLLDFTQDRDDPAIRFLGDALRSESATDSSITRLSQVPARSLLSRLTDQYRQIIASRAPIGFEAEFVGTRGHPMMYRGILMPFSSDGEAIDYLYGVINWKEVVDATTQLRLHAELAASRRVAPRPMGSAAAWADTPGAPLADGQDAAPPSPLERARRAPPIGSAAVAPGDAEFVLLLARASDAGSVAVLGRVDADAAAIDRAIGQLPG